MKLKDLPISWKLFLVIAVFALGFLLFGALALDTLTRYRINGPLFQRIIQGKDVVADVLPPPSYLVEAYLVVLQMIDETDPAKFLALTERSRDLRVQFLDRQEYWDKNLEAGPLRDTLIIRSQKSALQFLTVRDDEVIPALRRGERDAARKIALEKLKPLYDEHREAVDEVVRLANARVAADGALLLESDEQIRKRTQNLMILGVSFLVLASALGLLIARNITDLISRNVVVIDQIRSGNLVPRVKVDSQDELGRMGASLNQALDRMATLICSVQRSGIEVAGASTRLAASAKDQEASASEQAASTMEVVSSAREIAATTKELVDTIAQVDQVFNHTAAAASQGRLGVAAMRSSMDLMLEAAGSIMAKLSILTEKAANITTMITTINKVADQTNLLSLNAAIEAEKAGEYGRGFGVVAVEIRRLADQTGIATQDIEQMNSEMQSSVSTAVLGMNKFTEEIRQGVREVHQVAEQLSQIIEQVQNLSPRMDMVNHGMQTQLLGSRQISEAMSQLGQVAQQTAENVRQSTASVQQLRSTAQTLHANVSLFTVDAGEAPE